MRNIQGKQPVMDRVEGWITGTHSYSLITVNSSIVDSIISDGSHVKKKKQSDTCCMNYKKNWMAVEEGGK